MDNFLIWLEEKANIHFTGWWNDGTIQVVIDGRPYVYNADAAWHDRWKRMAQYAPGRVLNQIKGLVNTGRAQLVSAPPKVEKPLPPKTQGNLF